MANYQDNKCKRYVDTDRNLNWQQTRNEKKLKFKPQTINVNSKQQLEQAIRTVTIIRC